MCTHWKWPNKNTRKKNSSFTCSQSQLAFFQTFIEDTQYFTFSTSYISEEIFKNFDCHKHLCYNWNKKGHKGCFVPLSEEQTQKGWILKINLKSGSGCILYSIYIVRATTRSSLWHLSVTLPSNFRRFADTDSAPALTLLTADMLWLLSALSESFNFKLDRTEARAERSEREQVMTGRPIISFCCLLVPACLLLPVSSNFIYILLWCVCSVNQDFIYLTHQGRRRSQFCAKYFPQRIQNIFWRRILFISSLLCLFLF